MFTQNRKAVVRRSTMPIIYLAMRNLHSGLGLEDERSDMTELEALRELVAFREYGTLSAAADELRITQPTMTRTMRKLERESASAFDRRAKNRLSTHPHRRARRHRKPSNCSTPTTGSSRPCGTTRICTTRSSSDPWHRVPCIFSSKPASAMPNGNRPSPCGTVSLSPTRCSTTCCCARRR